MGGSKEVCDELDSDKKEREWGGECMVASFDDARRGTRSGGWRKVMTGRGDGRRGAERRSYVQVAIRTWGIPQYIFQYSVKQRIHLLPYVICRIGSNRNSSPQIHRFFIQ